MRKAFILCDGSYDSNWRIGTCAFSLVYNGETIRMTERFSNFDNATQCEFSGIEMAFKLLKDKLEKESESFSLDEVHVFTDSDKAVEIITKGKYASKKEKELYAPFRNKVLTNKSITKKISFHVLKSHVHESKANHIESKHNEIDELARKELNSFREDLINPAHQGSGYAGVILTNNRSKAKDAEMFRLGYMLAHNGYKVRAYGTLPKVKHKSFTESLYHRPNDFSDHPFYKGFMHCCSKKDYSTKPALETINSSDSPVFKNRSQQNNNGCEGLDACLYFKINSVYESRSDIDLNDKKAFRSGAVIRTMFGKNAFNNRMSLLSINKRAELPSEFVISFDKNTEKTKILDSLSELVGIPTYYSYEELKVDFTHLDEQRLRKKSSQPQLAQ